MTKLITVTSIRPGAGKTTVAAILAEKLAEKYTVCLIDNNQNNINIYSAISTTENINLYSCLIDKESCRKAIKECAAQLKKNLYFFSGGNELLTQEEIQVLKERDIFEYIIIDTEIYIGGKELADCSITVINPNKYEYEAAVNTAIEKDLIVINRYAETELKVRNSDFKLYFCPELINFANAYELKLPKNNEFEVNKLIEKITGEKLENGNKKLKHRLFGRS